MASVALKVLIVGDAGVGKTVFVNRHRTGEFEKKYIATLETEVTSLSFQTNKGLLILNVWDVAGQEKSRADHLTRASTNVDACIIMFDVGSRISYKNLGSWLTEIRRLNGDIPVVVCGNKVDVKERIVRPKDILFHKQHDLQHYDISAKSNYNFEKPFLYILQKRFGKDLVFTESPVVSMTVDEEEQDILATQKALQNFKEKYEGVPENIVKI